MRELGRIVISLPFALLLWPGLGARPAEAQVMSPVEATRHLAQAHAAEGKCHHLNEEERDELLSYVARAELTVASGEGVATATAAVAAGRSTGAAMECGAETEQTVRGAIDAARRAVADLKDAPRPASKRERQKAGQTGRQGVETFAVVTAEAQSTGLERYTREAAAYYLERRCRHLSDRQAVDFWNGIVRRHKSAVAAHGPRAVARAKARAEAQANSYRCGGQAAELVAATYRAVSGR